jgi:hypothetical protein
MAVYEPVHHQKKYYMDRSLYTMLYILIIWIYITGISNDGLYEYQNVIVS